MQALVQFMVRFLGALIGTILIWLYSFVTFNQPFLLASLYALLAGGTIYMIWLQVHTNRKLRRLGLSRKEYRFITNNLKEARQKMTRLRRAVRSVASLRQMKQYVEILYTVHKIYTNTKKEPRRFYKAEQFYYQHLDSLVELVEKYAFLSSQPAKTAELTVSLKETRHMISHLNEEIKRDLQMMLTDDLETLQFELSVAKQSIEKANDHRGVL